MKIGDLVKCNSWVHDGKTGVILEVQGGNYCVGAYVLLDIGLKLIRIENLEAISESG